MHKDARVSLKAQFLSVTILTTVCYNRQRDVLLTPRPWRVSQPSNVLFSMIRNAHSFDCPIPAQFYNRNCTCHASVSWDHGPGLLKVFTVAADRDAASVMAVQSHTGVAISIATYACEYTLPRYLCVVLFRLSTLHPGGKPPFFHLSLQLSV